MDDLIAFLAARCAEDERIAQGAARTDDGHGGRWLPVHFGRGGFDARVDDHLARHDPARVLRDVADTRRLIAEYERFDEGRGYQNALAFALVSRAAVYSDHPDYRPEWAPS